jgi:hypothetical protein
MLIHCSQSVFFLFPSWEHRAAHKLDRFAVIDLIYKDILRRLFLISFVTQENLEENQKNLKNSPKFHVGFVICEKLLEL